MRGTGVTYEDLALKFLYWQNARVTGENSIRTRNCWKLELKAPSRQSQYSNVFLWVDKEGGALMRMEGYDWNGQLAKRFEVVSAQKIEGRWFLKQMRIEEIQPGTGKCRRGLISRSRSRCRGACQAPNQEQVLGHKRPTFPGNGTGAF